MSQASFCFAFLFYIALFIALIFHPVDSSWIIVKVPSLLADMPLLIIKIYVEISD